MKLVVWIIGVVVLIGAINYSNWNQQTKPARNPIIERLESYNPIVNAEKTVIDESAKMQVKLLEQQEKIKRDAFNSQKVKVYVRAKDTKTCMKLLEIDILNNEVAECNKDHYVEVRNDEVENFKKEQRQ